MASMKQTDQSKLKRGFNTRTVFESNTTEKTENTRKQETYPFSHGRRFLGAWV